MISTDLFQISMGCIKPVNGFLRFSLLMVLGGLFFYSLFFSVSVFIHTLFEERLPIFSALFFYEFFMKRRIGRTIRRATHK
jgi:hypothetical protein